MFIVRQGRVIVKQDIKTYQKALQFAYEAAKPEVPTKNLSKKQINALNFLIEEVG